MNAGADATAAAVNRAAAARSWVVLLISDMSWLVGMAEGSGNTVPPRITDDLGEAISWLAGTP
jgi:hypothetical protein